jgi:hypothetical protein
MRTSLTALAMLLATGLAAPAAHAADPATQAAGTEATSDKSKKVCRSIVKSGTRFSQRICRSKEAWDKDAEAAARYLEKGQTTGSTRNSGITNVP